MTDRYKKYSSELKEFTLWSKASRPKTMDELYSEFRDRVIEKISMMCIVKYDPPSAEMAIMKGFITQHVL